MVWATEAKQLNMIFDENYVTIFGAKIVISKCLIYNVYNLDYEYMDNKLMYPNWCQYSHELSRVDVIKWGRNSTA